MFAVVSIAGQQYKVKEGQELFVHHLGEEEGAKVSFGEVLLVNNNGAITVGAPTISAASVGATVITDQQKGDKVVVFKKKRRKGYKVKNGHRQLFSKIKIDSIKA